MYKAPIRDIHDVVVLERYLQRRTYEEISLLKRTYEEIEEIFGEILGDNKRNKYENKYEGVTR